MANPLAGVLIALILRAIGCLGTVDSLDFSTSCTQVASTQKEDDELSLLQVAIDRHRKHEGHRHQNNVPLGNASAQDGLEAALEASDALASETFTEANGLNLTHTVAAHLPEASPQDGVSTAGVEAVLEAGDELASETATNTKGSQLTQPTVASSTLGSSVDPDGTWHTQPANADTSTHGISVPTINYSLADVSNIADVGSLSPLVQDQNYQVTALNRYPAVFMGLKELLGAKPTVPAAPAAPVVMPTFIQNTSSNKSVPLKLLSFGCSDGSEVHSLRMYFPDAIIHGVDIDSELIARNTMNNTDPLVEYFNGTELLQAEGYDAALAMSVLCRQQTKDDHLPFANYVDTVSLLDTLVKPGGYLVIYNADYPFTEYPYSFRFKNMAAGAGCSVGLPLTILSADQRFTASPNAANKMPKHGGSGVCSYWGKHCIESGWRWKYTAKDQQVQPEGSGFMSFGCMHPGTFFEKLLDYPDQSVTLTANADDMKQAAEFTTAVNAPDSTDTFEAAVDPRQVAEAVPLGFQGDGVGGYPQAGHSTPGLSNIANFAAAGGIQMKLEQMYPTAGMSTEDYYAAAVKLGGYQRREAASSGVGYDNWMQGYA